MSVEKARPEVAVDSLAVSAYRVPTEEPESDGTLTWTATTVVAVEVEGGGATGLGWTYGAAACGSVVDDALREAVVGNDAMDPPVSWSAMVDAVRNIGRPGVASMAVAAVDIALWDLKARLLELPLGVVLGRVRPSVPVYGSGGFTSLTDDELADQLGGWVHGQGIPKVKLKVGTAWGRDVGRDVGRVVLARKAVGADAELLVDANGAYAVKQAVRTASAFEAEGVTWFEEPVSSDDLPGLREVRARTDLEVAAGEYGWDVGYFERMCGAGAVDVLQADVSRCCGITEWLRAAAVAAGHGLQVSGHCAQSLHAHPACAVVNLRHLEYFADHARVDRLLFDGVLDPAGGELAPDWSRPGTGLDLRRRDAERYRIA